MRRGRSSQRGGRRPVVGLDIGSSAIRAVELMRTREGPKVVRFGQVGLKPGVVVDGEVRDASTLAASLRRLWTEAGFRDRSVCVSAGGQRVIVREADVPAMSAEDFRSAMVFEVQDLIPIATADAIMDFSILGDSEPDSQGRARMRITLSAADRQGIMRLLDALRLAGLRPVTVDVPQAALLRATRGVFGGGVEGLVSVGADLTTVIVRTPRQVFSRTLAIGASEVTRGIGLRLGAETDEAEAVKRYASGVDRAASRAGTLVSDESGPLVDQIIESIEYFLSQAEVEHLERLHVTGGGSETAGLLQQLADRVNTDVRLVDPFADVDASGLDASVASRARVVATHAVGLASWPWDPPTQRTNLLPVELVEAERRRRILTACVGVGVVLVLALSAVWYGRHVHVDDIRSQVASVDAQRLALQDDSAALAGISRYFAAVEGRQAALSALAGSVDWPRLIAQIEATLPPEFQLQTIETANGAPAAAAGSSSASTTTSSTGSSGVVTPTVQMTIDGKGGEELVASFLQAMTKLSSLDDVLVPSSSTTGSTTTFTASATVTGSAPHITYAWEAKK